MWQQILHIDQQLLLALNGSWGGFWDTCFYIVTARLTWIPLYAAILYFAWRKIGTRNLLWMLVCLGVAVIAADQICNFFKHYTPKLRPSHTPRSNSSCTRCTATAAACTAPYRPTRR